MRSKTNTHSWLILGSLLGLLALLSPGAEARHFPLHSPPESFEEVKEMVTKTIPKNLEQAQCGGWDKNQSVEGKISVVTGVPGHKGDPLGNIESGMAKRIEDGGTLDDGFEFPDTAKGLVTACLPNRKKIPKRIWSDAEQKFTQQEFAHPYYTDTPPCLWRSEKDPVTDPKFEDYDGKEKQKDPPHSPKVCQEFCQWLNQWKYRDCAKVVATITLVGVPVPIVTGYRCAEWKERYLCTDHFVEGGGDPCQPGISLQPEGNATGCQGEECRCGAPKEGVPAESCRLGNIASYTREALLGPQTIPHPGSRQNSYMSYFRTYEADATRDKVQTDNTVDNPRDKNKEENIAVACYGVYDAFDPKLQRTGRKDRRCVIDLDVSDRLETQKGKGKYGPDDAWKDPDVVQRNPAYDKEKDLWYPNLGGGISFVNDTIFRGRLDQDLSTALLTVDTATIKAISPFGGEKTTAAQIRAFDDTVSAERGDERTVTEWWQTFEASAHKLFSPPIIRLLIPPTWSFGVDHLDPIFQRAVIATDDPSDPVVRAGTRKDPRMESIEVQLHAREDLLGSIAAFLERSLLLRVEEEPIPVVVPLGADFRSYAQTWQTYINSLKNSEGTPLAGLSARIADAERYMQELLKYADQVEKVRELRAELPRSIGAVAAAQSAITQEIARWMESNLTAYKDFLKSRAERLALQKIWIAAQQAYVDFHDRTNMPWCRSDRFTLPIYSLLDSWMPPAGPRGAARVLSLTDAFPKLVVPKEEDLVLDFSNLRIAAGTAKIPILKPTFVRIRVELPRTNTPDFPIPKEPFLTFPEIPSIYQKITQSIPKVKVILPPSVIKVPEALDLTQATEALAEARRIISDMNAEYQKFWESLSRTRDDDWDPPVCPIGKEGEKKEMEGLDCCGWNQANCVHVEMDLMERLVRITARPAVLLKEDFQSVATSLSGGSSSSASVRNLCDPKDQVCLTLHPERREKPSGWQILFPNTPAGGAASSLGNLRYDMLRKTFTPAGKLPINRLPYDVPAPLLYPTFGVPPSVNLFPDSGSSSSAASSRSP